MTGEQPGSLMFRDILQIDLLTFSFRQTKDMLIKSLRCNFLTTLMISSKGRSKMFSLRMV